MYIKDRLLHLQLPVAKWIQIDYNNHTQTCINNKCMMTNISLEWPSPTQCITAPAILWKFGQGGIDVLWSSYISSVILNLEGWETTVWSLSGHTGHKRGEKGSESIQTWDKVCPVIIHKGSGFTRYSAKPDTYSCLQLRLVGRSRYYVRALLWSAIFP